MILSCSVIPALFRSSSPLALPLCLILDVIVCSHFLNLFPNTDRFFPPYVMLSVTMTLAIYFMSWGALHEDMWHWDCCMCAVMMDFVAL